MCRAVVVDSLFRVVDVSDDFAKMFGRRRDAIRSMSFLDLIDVDARADVQVQLEWLFRGERRCFTQRAGSVSSDDDVRMFDFAAIALHEEGAADVELAMIIALLVEPAVIIGEFGPVLTDVDARVLEGIAMGEPTTRIASRLHLSPQGVEYHVTSMLRKFKAPCRAALISRAFHLGVFVPAGWPPKVLSRHVK